VTQIRAHLALGWVVCAGLDGWVGGWQGGACNGHMRLPDCSVALARSMTLMSMHTAAGGQARPCGVPSFVHAPPAATPMRSILPQATAVMTGQATTLRPVIVRDWGIRPAGVGGSSVWHAWCCGHLSALCRSGVQASSKLLHLRVVGARLRGMLLCCHLSLFYMLLQGSLATIVWPARPR